MTYTSTGAGFSNCGRYRYWLRRRWGTGRRWMVVLGLNPSTATETEDDPTVRRCVGFAKREECDGLTMLNIFALRATDPRVMLRHPSPVGLLNDAHIRVILTRPTHLVVAAWGVHGAHLDRGLAVRKMLAQHPVMALAERPVMCFGLTKNGEPKHPLYLRADAPLVPVPEVIDLMDALRASL